MSAIWRIFSLFLILMLGTLTAAWGATQPQQSTISSEFSTGGERLFTGVIAFQNGGPPCMACHNISGIPFPGGGTVGPDLTGAARKYGAALGATLATLPFPTMVPIFGKRPLTQTEQQSLEAFFKQTPSTPSPNSSAKIAIPAAGGFILFLVLVWVVWRRRLVTVRRAMLRSGGAQS